jgi:hypothetical protein
MLMLFASFSDVEQNFRFPKNTIVRHRRTGTRIAYINTGMTSDVSNSVYVAKQLAKLESDGIQQLQPWMATIMRMR